MPGNIATRSGALLVAALVVTAAVPGLVGGTQTGEEPSFVVTLDADGSAEIAVTLTFDLTTDSERAAFEELRDNETAQAEARTKFRNRMESVAAAAQNETGREMSVEAASIELTTTDGGDTGIVVLSVTWTGLAAVENGRLVVTEPFASGFEPDRTFVVNWPDGHELDSATPSPDATSDTSATWDAGTDLDGFELAVAQPTPAATPTPTETETPADGGAPGFGVGIALVALLVAAILASRRR